MKIPPKYLVTGGFSDLEGNRVGSDPNGNVMQGLTHEGIVLIKKLKDSGVVIPYLQVSNQDITLRFNIQIHELYSGINLDYGILRHRLQIITEHQYDNMINSMSNNDVLAKDSEIHENVLNTKIRVGNDEEKNMRWQSLTKNSSAIIYYGLDFLLFKKLYWDIGQKDTEIKQFAIDYYIENWPAIQFRYGIPSLPSRPFWQDPLFLKFVVAVAGIFTAGYIYSTYFASAGTVIPVSTVESSITPIVAIEANATPIAYTAMGEGIFTGVTGELVTASGHVLTGMELTTITAVDFGVSVGTTITGAEIFLSPVTGELVSGSGIAFTGIELAGAVIGVETGAITGIGTGTLATISGGLTSVGETIGALIGIKESLSALSEEGIPREEQISTQKYIKPKEETMTSFDNLLLVSLAGIFLLLMSREN